MTEGICVPRCRIDSVHQMPFLSIEIVNIYLNIIGSELK